MANTGPGKHRHLDSRGKWTTDKDPDHVHSETPNPADVLTAQEVADVKTMLIAHGFGGTTPVPNPPPTPPPNIAAQNIATSGVTTNGVTISWTTTDASTGYVEYGTTTGYGTSTSSTSSGTSGSRTLSGLTPGQTYHYRVVTNSGTTTLMSSDRQFTTTAAATLPGAPQNLVATGGNTQVVLTWTAPASNGGSAITGYHVYRNGASLVTLGNVLTYTNTGLTNGLTYSYTVAAITAVGEGPQSAAASATPSAGGDINPPVISNVAITNVTTTGATVSWSLNEGGTGQVEYGISIAYGSTTTLEAGYLTAHSQTITGLTPNTLYHLRVRSADAAGNLALSSDRTFTTLQTTPPTPPPSSLIYGPGVGYEGKSNEQLNVGKQSCRFRASQTSNAVSVAVNVRTGPVYSGGTGGTVKVSIQTDSAGNPSGTILGSVTWVPGNPGIAENKAHHTFGSPIALQAGTLYHIVCENTDPSPTTNWVSMNYVLAYNPADTPRQPAFSDDFAVLRRVSSWGLQNGYIPVFDLLYANGQHDGSQYFAVVDGNDGIITGTANMARARFTPSATGTYDSAYIQVRRNSGSADLSVRLETGAGTNIETVVVPAASIAVRAVGNVAQNVAWTPVPFVTPRTLTAGQTYNLRLSCAAGTQYSVMPLRWHDSDMNAWDGYHFRDGAGNGNGSSGQATTNGGSSWFDLYAFDSVDFGWYFR